MNLVDKLFDVIFLSERGDLMEILKAAKREHTTRLIALCELHMSDGVRQSFSFLFFVSFIFLYLEA